MKYLFLLAAWSCFAQPVWTDIMNQTGQTNALSGVYWEFNNGFRTVPKTSIATFSVMSVPRSNVGTPVVAGGNDPSCTVQPSYWSTKPPYYRNPQQRLESYQMTGVKGVGFLGNFQSGTLGNFGTGSYLIQTVYFHEQGCYQGGREFGIWFDEYNQTMYAYWEVNANCGAAYCTAPSDSNCTGCKSGVDAAHNEPIGLWANSQEYFAIYPTGNASSCAMQVTIISPSFAMLYNKSLPVGSDITSIDPAFCANVTAPVGESGYVTAGTLYGPMISSVALSNELILSRVFVGK